MRLRQGGLRRLARTVSVVLAVTLASAGLTTTQVAMQAMPASAHARLAGTAPENHAHIDELPDRVTVFLTGKPTTIEGDPIRVFGPTGERVDAGDVRLVEGEDEDDPTALSVALPPEAAEERGEYHVVFRVVSRDTHLVAGRFMFHFGEPEGSAVLPIGASPSRPESLVHGWPADQAHWPKLVAVAGVVLALVGLVCQRWRRTRREAAEGARMLAAGLVSGRRLD